MVGFILFLGFYFVFYQPACGLLLERLHILPQLTVEGMAAEGVAVAKDDELHACPGDGHVHAAQVAQEANLSLIVGAHQGDDDDVALLSLEAVDGVHRNQAAERLEELTLPDELPEILHLCAIGRDDTHVEPLAQDALLANQLIVGLEGEKGQMSLKLIGK